MFWHIGLHQLCTKLKDTYILISQYNTFACYHDNCHINNNVLKVKAQAHNRSSCGAI